MKDKLEKARSWKSVNDVRVLGAIGVVETKDPVNMAEFQKRCVERGVWIRPFNRNAYIMPPFMAVSDEQVEKLCDVLLDIIHELHEVPALNGEN